MSAKIKNSVIVIVLLGVVFIVWHFKTNKPELVDTRPLEAIPGSATPISSYSYLDILENAEFRTEMQEAVRNYDQDKARMLQDKAIEIALVAQLPVEELNLIKGEKGLNFMQFLAKRQLFLIDFERRYKNLEGINDIKAMYPEAKELFPRSDHLISQRDAEIQAIAAEIAEGGPIDEYLYLAKQQWLQAAKQTASQN